MCFRPAAVGEGPVPIICSNCGKRVNPVAGELPSKCPFCKTEIDPDECEPIYLGMLGTPGAPGAPGVPSAPAAPGVPVAPAAPK